MERIKFLSYTGKYPNLCSGVLTLEIDGVKTVFGGKDGYTPFWISGGSCGFSNDWSEEHVEKGDWYMSSNYGDYEENYQDRDLYPELIEIFNGNVQNGCCGGCL